MQVAIKRKVLNPRVWVDTKGGDLTAEEIRAFTLNGWIEAPVGQQTELVIERRDGSVLVHPLNQDRPKVVAYLEKKKGGAYLLRNGFSYEIDASDAVRVGYKRDTVIVWEYALIVTTPDASEGKGKRYVFGPSHIVRLNHAIQSRQIPPLNGDYEIVGAAGMPVWSPRVSRRLKELDARDEVFMMVGDFRLGNAILAKETYPARLPRKEYILIDRKLISSNNDSFLYRLCLGAIEQYLAMHPGKTRLHFWSLSIRESENIAKGSYSVDGVYRHPTWNYADVSKKFEANTIDSRTVIEHAKRLYVDSSAHPSFLGWSYLWNTINGAAHFDLANAIEVYERLLKSELSRCTEGKLVYVTGDSAFSKFTKKFDSDGIFPLPENIKVLSLQEMQDAPPADHCILASNLCAYRFNEDELLVAVEETRLLADTLRARHTRVSVIFFDNWACEKVSERTLYLGQYTPKSPTGETSNLEALVCDTDQAYRVTQSFEAGKILEANNSLCPTAFGFMEVLMRSVSGCLREDVDRSYEVIVDALFPMNDDQV